MSKRNRLIRLLVPQKGRRSKKKKMLSKRKWPNRFVHHFLTSTVQTHIFLHDLYLSLSELKTCNYCDCSSSIERTQEGWTCWGIENNIGLNFLFFIPLNFYYSTGLNSFHFFCQETHVMEEDEDVKSSLKPTYKKSFNSSWLMMLFLSLV